MVVQILLLNTWSCELSALVYLALHRIEFLPQTKTRLLISGLVYKLRSGAGLQRNKTWRLCILMPLKTATYLANEFNSYFGHTRSESKSDVTIVLHTSLC